MPGLREIQVHTTFKNWVLRALSHDNAIANLYFTVSRDGGRISYSSRDYRRIKGHVSRDNIRVISNDDIPRGHVDKLPSYAVAAYNAQYNVMIFNPQRMNTYGEVKRDGFIIHECTHAILDMHRATATTELTDESAAYIAQYIYILSRNPYFYVSPRNTIHVCALELAEMMINPLYPMLVGGMRVVTYQAISELRNAISRNGAYANASTTTYADGISAPS